MAQSHKPGLTEFIWVHLFSTGVLRLETVSTLALRNLSALTYSRIAADSFGKQNSFVVHRWLVQSLLCLCAMAGILLTSNTVDHEKKTIFPLLLLVLSLQLILSFSLHPLKCNSSVILSSSSSFSLSPSSLICWWLSRGSKPPSLSSEICEFVARNVRPSWHYSVLYRLTRGVGGEGEEERRMLGC